MYYRHVFMISVRLSALLVSGGYFDYVLFVYVLYLIFFYVFFFFFHSIVLLLFFFFFFNDTATTEIYTLSLHDALPILYGIEQFLTAMVSVVMVVNLSTTTYIAVHPFVSWAIFGVGIALVGPFFQRDRKSTRLNSSHSSISYAVFCLKKKKKKNKHKYNEQNKQKNKHKHY